MNSEQKVDFLGEIIMLRKFLTIITVLLLLVSFGCKKKESSPAPPDSPKTQEQVEETSDEGMKEIEAMEKEAEAAEKEAASKAKEIGAELQE